MGRKRCMRRYVYICKDWVIPRETPVCANSWIDLPLRRHSGIHWTAIPCRQTVCTPALDRIKRLATRTGYLNPGDRATGTYWIRALVWSVVSLEFKARKNFLTVKTYSTLSVRSNSDQRKLTVRDMGRNSHWTLLGLSSAFYFALNTCRNLTSKDLAVTALISGQIFFWKIPALIWASRDVTVTVFMNRCI